MDRKTGLEPVRELSLLLIQSQVGYQLPYFRTNIWLAVMDSNQALHFQRVA